MSDEEIYFVTAFVKNSHRKVIKEKDFSFYF